MSNMRDKFMNTTFLAQLINSLAYHSHCFWCTHDSLSMHVVSVCDVMTLNALKFLTFMKKPQLNKLYNLLSPTSTLHSYLHTMQLSYKYMLSIAIYTHVHRYVYLLIYSSWCLKQIFLHSLVTNYFHLVCVYIV